MPFFTFKHLTYEFPPDVSVIVREVDAYTPYEGDSDRPPVVDFDFYKDGQVIASVATYDDNGNDLGGWHAHGIKRVKRVRYEDLS